jgi:hypothetical protein
VVALDWLEAFGVGEELEPGLVLLPSSILCCSPLQELMTGSSMPGCCVKTCRNASFKA